MISTMFNRNASNTKQMKYERLIAGKALVESSLHRHLAEHLNSEVVLQTVTDVAVAMNWIRSTFLYVRALRNPRHYGIPTGLSKQAMEAKLQDLCMRELNALAKYKLLTMAEGYDVQSTEAGTLMARYYIAFDTMKLFVQVKGTESLLDLLELISRCEEFSDFVLRFNERTTLNALNKNKERTVIRFPIKNRIKTKEAKINCLIQASLGCLTISDSSMNQDATRVTFMAERLTKALLQYVWDQPHYQLILNAIVLAKCIQCRLWENSEYIARQLPGIGPALASLLHSAGKTSFQAIKDSNPRDLERILNRHPPLGNQLQATVASIPQYELSLTLNSPNKVTVTLQLNNPSDPRHRSTLLIGTSDNTILHKEKLMDEHLIRKGGVYTVSVTIENTENVKEVEAHLISWSWVGIDCRAVVKVPSKNRTAATLQTPIDMYLGKRNTKKINNPKMKRNNQLMDKETASLLSKFTDSTNLQRFVFKPQRNSILHIEDVELDEGTVSSTQEHIEVELEDDNTTENNTEFSSLDRNDSEPAVKKSRLCGSAAVMENNVFKNQNDHLLLPLYDDVGSTHVKRSGINRGQNCRSYDNYTVVSSSKMPYERLPFSNYMTSNISTRSQNIDPKRASHINSCVKPELSSDCMKHSLQTEDKVIEINTLENETDHRFQPNLRHQQHSFTCDGDVISKRNVEYNHGFSSSESSEIIPEKVENDLSGTPFLTRDHKTGITVLPETQRAYSPQPSSVNLYNVTDMILADTRENQVINETGSLSAKIQADISARRSLPTNDYKPYENCSCAKSVEPKLLPKRSDGIWNNSAQSCSTLTDCNVMADERQNLLGNEIKTSHSVVPSEDCAVSTGDTVNYTEYNSLNQEIDSLVQRSVDRIISTGTAVNHMKCNSTNQVNNLFGQSHLNQIDSQITKLQSGNKTKLNQEVCCLKRQSLVLENDDVIEVPEPLEALEKDGGCLQDCLKITFSLSQKLRSCKYFPLFNKKEELGDTSAVQPMASDVNSMQEQQERNNKNEFNLTDNADLVSQLICSEQKPRAPSSASSLKNMPQKEVQTCVTAETLDERQEKINDMHEVVSTAHSESATTNKLEVRSDLDDYLTLDQLEFDEEGDTIAAKNQESCRLNIPKPELGGRLECRDKEKDGVKHQHYYFGASGVGSYLTECSNTDRAEEEATCGDQILSQKLNPKCCCSCPVPSNMGELPKRTAKGELLQELCCPFAKSGCLFCSKSILDRIKAYSDDRVVTLRTQQSGASQYVQMTSFNNDSFMGQNPISQQENMCACIRDSEKYDKCDTRNKTHVVPQCNNSNEKYLSPNHTAFHHSAQNNNLIDIEVVFDKTGYIYNKNYNAKSTTNSQLECDYLCTNYDLKHQGDGQNDCGKCNHIQCFAKSELRRSYLNLSPEADDIYEAFGKCKLRKMKTNVDTIKQSFTKQNHSTPCPGLDSCDCKHGNNSSERNTDCVGDVMNRQSHNSTHFWNKNKFADCRNTPQNNQQQNQNENENFVKRMPPTLSTKPEENSHFVKHGIQFIEKSNDQVENVNIKSQSVRSLPSGIQLSHFSCGSPFNGKIFVDRALPKNKYQQSGSEPENLTKRKQGKTHCTKHEESYYKNYGTHFIDKCNDHVGNAMNIDQSLDSRVQFFDCVEERSWNEVLSLMPNSPQQLNKKDNPSLEKDSYYSNHKRHLEQKHNDYIEHLKNCNRSLDSGIQRFDCDGTLWNETTFYEPSQITCNIPQSHKRDLDSLGLRKPSTAVPILQEDSYYAKNRTQFHDKQNYHNEPVHNKKQLNNSGEQSFYGTGTPCNERRFHDHSQKHRTEQQLKMQPLFVGESQPYKFCNLSNDYHSGESKMVRSNSAEKCTTVEFLEAKTKLGSVSHSGLQNILSLSSNSWNESYCRPSYGGSSSINSLNPDAMSLPERWLSDQYSNIELRTPDEGGTTLAGHVPPRKTATRDNDWPSAFPGYESPLHRSPIYSHCSLYSPPIPESVVVPPCKAPSALELIGVTNPDMSISPTTFTQSYSSQRDLFDSYN